MKPKISVVIPTYNRVKVLENAINSVIAQTFTDWELLVVDDCSTDNTQQFVESLAERDSRIQYHKLAKNGGANVARNFGIQKSSADIISFLDSDDLMHPENLMHQHLSFSRNAHLGVCYVGADYYNDNQFLFTVHNMERGDNLEVYLYLNLKGLGSSTSGFSVKRQVFQQVGDFDVEMASQQDLDFLVRAARVFYIDFIEGCNTKMFTNSNNRISDNAKAVIKGEQQFMEKHEARIRELGLYHHVARKLARKYAIYAKDLKLAYHYLFQSIKYRPSYMYAYLYALKLPILYFKK